MTPLYWTRYMLALRFAKRAHTGQLYGTEPYINHCVRVASRFTDPTLRCAAVLHDVLEDASWWAKDETNLAYQFGFEVAHLVRVLSRAEGETYEHYIMRLPAEPEAARIKLSDLADHLAHNPRPSLRRRYLIAKDFLEQALATAMLRQTYLDEPWRLPQMLAMRRDADW